MSAQLDTDAKDDVVLVRNGGAVIAVRQGGDSLGLTDTMAPPRREASPSAGLAKRTAPSPVSQNYAWYPVGVGACSTRLRTPVSVV